MSDDLERIGGDVEAPDFAAKVLALSAAARAQGRTPAEQDDRDERREMLRNARVTDQDLVAHILRCGDKPTPAPGHIGCLKACDAVDWFSSDRRKRTLVLLGSTGTGKTWAACWALARESGLFLPFARLTPTQEGGALYDRATTTPLLVLNDLSEPSSAWQAGQVAALICDRHDAGRRTIVTTNLFVRGDNRRLSIEHHYTDRVADRMEDIRHSRAVACMGPSLRQVRTEAA